MQLGTGNCNIRTEGLSKSNKRCLGDARRICRWTGDFMKPDIKNILRS